MLESQAVEKIIVALDCDEARAMDIAGELSGKARWLKVGMTLFYSAGPDIVRRFKDMGFNVFLDLKLHDIPHQVSCAAAALCSLGVDMVTVHASGGVEMMKAAVNAFAAGQDFPTVLAVTVLTSTDGRMLEQIGVERGMEEQVECLAKLSGEAGCGGVVCSAAEASLIRKALGDKAAVVCPGIRPANAAACDQKRVATPASAISAGASHLVIGRPITQADSPSRAFDSIVSELVR